VFTYDTALFPYRRPAMGVQVEELVRPRGHSSPLTTRFLLSIVKIVCYPRLGSGGVGSAGVSQTKKDTACGSISI